MKSTGKKLILVAFILAMISSITVFLYLSSLNKPKEVIRKVTVLVAADNIPARTRIDKKMVKEIEVPEAEIFNDFIKDSSEVIGKYSKETILKDEGFRKDKLADKDGDDLGFKIPARHRAVSLFVSGHAGVSNLVKPEDYVDVVVYLPEKRDGQEIVRPDMARIILQNIRVLAVDREMSRNTNSKEEEAIPSTFLVTLSVPVEEVEKIVLAEDIGNLKLVLRPMDMEDKKETNGTTWQELTVQSGSQDEDAADNSADNPITGSVGNGTKGYTYYTIKRGDSLTKISYDFYGDPDKYILIKEFNKIRNINTIIVGEVIKIPILER
jgi:pilus assembly protein CpaB